MIMDTQATGPTSDEMVARFGALIDGDDDTGADDEELTEDNAEGSDPEGELEAGAEGTDEETDEQPGQLYTVRVDGEEIQVPLEELAKGYQRQADYTRKAMALAEARKSQESEFNTVRAERAQYAQWAQEMLQQMQQQMGPEPDWERLQQDDPIGYAATWARRQQQREQLAALDQRRQLVMAQQQRDQEAQLQRTLAQEQQLLAAAIPDLADPERASLVKADLAAYGKKLGFSESELNEVYDHRAVVALYKAAQYDRLMSQKPKLQQAQKARPERVIAPGAAGKATVPTTQRAVKRLSQTGRVVDAARVLERFL
jgi:hypothetical protein